MKQPAIWYFTLLREAYKRDAYEVETSSIVACVPSMKDSERNRYFRQLASARRDIIDVGRENTDYSAIEALKKEF